MHTHQIGVRALALAAALLVLLLPQAHAAKWSLPDAAAEAIKANFPGASVTSVGREHERGAWYYEVTLKGGGRRFEVEVTDDGVIGEIEAEVKLADLPSELVQTLRQRVGTGRVTRVEKHERRGIARNGRFVPLAEPKISYEVKYVDANGRRREVQLASNQILELPEPVRAQIAAQFPDVTIAEAEAEMDEDAIVYALTLLREDQPIEVTLLPDGRILEMLTPAEASSLPSVALTALQGDKELRQTDPARFYRHEVWGTLRKGKVVEQQAVTHIVRVFRQDSEREYRYDSQGRLTNRPTWQKSEAEDDDEDDDGWDDKD